MVRVLEQSHRRKSLRHATRVRNCKYSIFIMVIVGFILFALLWTYRIDVFTWLESLPASALTAAVFFVLSVYAVMPCTYGYTWIMLGCAYVFKWWSLPIVYLGSVLGCLFTFKLGRYLKKHEYIDVDVISELLGRYGVYLEVLEVVIASKGFKAMTLIQLSYAPVGLSTIGFAQTEAEFYDLILASFISRLKVIPYIAIGVTITGFLDWMIGQGSASIFTDTKTLVLAAIGFVFSLLALVFLAYWTRSQLQKLEAVASEMKEVRITSDIDELEYVDVHDVRS